MEVLHRLLRVDGPLVGFGTRHRLPGGEVLVSRSTLRFVAREEVATAPPGLTGPPGRGQ